MLLCIDRVWHVYQLTPTSEPPFQVLRYAGEMEHMPPIKPAS